MDQAYETTEFTLNDQDSIVFIQGFYSKSNKIKGLLIETKFGNIFNFNAKFEKKLQNLKSFAIRCRLNYRVMGLIGGFDYFEEEGIWALVYLGLEMLPTLSSTRKMNLSLEKNPKESIQFSEFITQVPDIVSGRGKSALVGHKRKNKK